jgi:glycerol-3-phosphate dehydrogenase (NAD(P)+)
LNTKYFNKQKLYKKPSLVTNQIAQIFKNKPTFILLAVPSVFIESTIKKFINLLNYKCIVINVAKGLNQDTNKTWFPSIKKMMGNKCKGIVTLIGPSFAIEVFKGAPTIVNTISDNLACCRIVNALFNNSHFKCVETKDVIGAEILGALKNVMAIAMGVAYELHASINTRAAMLSEAVKEISKVVKIYGGDINTITQFCGIGDIYLTCTDDKSRNFSFGKQVAKVGIKNTLKNNVKTVEGYLSTKIIYKVIKKYRVNAPIFDGIYEVLFENKNPKTFVPDIIKKIID